MPCSSHLDSYSGAPPPVPPQPHLAVPCCRRKQREAKRFSKEVQAERRKDKAQQRKAAITDVTKLRKQRQKSVRSCLPGWGLQGHQVVGLLHGRALSSAIQPEPIQLPASGAPARQLPKPSTPASPLCFHMSACP